MTEQAFSELIETYSDMVTRICVLRTGNMMDAQDCYQNTFLKCFTRLPGNADTEQQKAWIIRVAINECNSLLRKRKKENWTELEDVYAVYPNLDRNGILPQIMSLKPDYRDCIFLYYYEGYSIAEIAKILHQPENTVKTHMRRAKTLLRDVLEGEN